MKFYKLRIIGLGCSILDLQVCSWSQPSLDLTHVEPAIVSLLSGEGIAVMSVSTARGLSWIKV